MGKFTKFLRVTFRWVVLLMAGWIGASGSLIGLTQGQPIASPDREYDVCDDGLLIGGYCANPNNLQSVQYADEAGLDFLICSVNEAFLDECERVGISVIAKNYNAPSLYATVSQDAVNKWLALDKETNYKNHPALFGDDVIDEPSSQYFGEISSIVNSYYEKVPGKLPYINLFPMYANSEQLGNKPEIPSVIKTLLPSSDFSDMQIDQYKRHVSDYINKIDTSYISVDIYPYGVRTDSSGDAVKTTNETWLRNLDILAEACKKTNKNLWVIVQAAGNVNDGKGGTMRHCDTAEDMRQQAFASLAFGAKAVIYACYQTGWWDDESHMLDKNGTRTDTYYAAQTVNNELKEFAELYGEYEYDGTYMLNDADVAGQKYCYLVNDDGLQRPNIQSGAGLLVGAFSKKTDSSKKGYVIVNMQELAEQSAETVKLTIPGDSGMTVFMGETVRDYETNTTKIELAPGAGMFVAAK